MNVSKAGPPTSWILELRSRLGSPPPRRLPPKEARHAAVLVPLYVDAGELWTVLTQRTDKLPHHKSQFAFPGGSLDPGESAWDAALRETEEEVGFASERILRLGELDEAETPSGFRIVPCVGAVAFPFEPRINEDEIAEVFSVPLTALANPRLVEEQPVVINGRERRIRIYHVGSRRVWGLTALILHNLLVRLGLETEPS
jgi:8-oxo-dGTP pyrophosphatase MutT (NUDIX family)